MSVLLFAGLLIMSSEAQVIDVQERLLRLEDGSILRYTIAIPEYDTERKVPLILALHYGGWEDEDNSLFYGKGILLRLIEPAMAELEAIVVAPDCPGTDWSDSTSVAAVLALLDHITNWYLIDTDKIVLTGYSLGGNGVWHLAAHHPARFSAAIPIAAHPPLDLVDQLTDLPIFVIHSRDDEQVPIEPTDQMVRLLLDRGAPVQYLIVEGITHHQTIRFRDHLRSTIPWLKKTWRLPD